MSDHEETPETNPTLNIEINHRDIIRDRPIDGEGAMSFVITGIYGKQRVILKKPISKEDKEWNINEFENESRHLLSIRHKNVVALHGITKLPNDDGWWLVLEYCEKGSLSSMLGINNDNGPKPKVDIERKFQFCIDIASGMNICHINNPPILHRDLKNANIFVNSEWVAKVGDFGLSQNLKHRTFRVELDKLGAAGTSQYYPPEILRAEFLDNAFRYEKTVSSKSDVWAFGLMIWEIFTQKKAWKDLLDEIQWNAKLFSEELCDKGRLPDMEKSIPTQLVPIIVSCLKTNGEDRPSFSQLVDRLINAQIEYFLQRDELAIAFWKNNWMKNWEGNNKVSWEKFKESLKSFLKVADNVENDLVWNMLKSRLVNQEGHVTLSLLEKVICWFGPLKSEDGNIIQRILRFFSTPGIHFRGAITTATTDTLLKNEDPGTFFIRLNEGGNVSSTEAPWTLSIHIKKKGVKHLRIHLAEDGGLVFKSAEYPLNKASPSLFKLIEELRHAYPKEFAHPMIERAETMRYGDE